MIGEIHGHGHLLVGLYAVTPFLSEGTAQSNVNIYFAKYIYYFSV